MKIVSRTEKIIRTFFIAIAVILFWRGCWNLADLYLFPKNGWLSAVAGIVIALIILISSHKFIKRVV